ncbi:MAG: hypothetical protein ACRD27_05800, partial [Terracidiphilus sp.]
MKGFARQDAFGTSHRVRTRRNIWTAALLLATFPGAMMAQNTAAVSGAASSPSGRPAQSTYEATPPSQPARGARHRATRAYLRAIKLFLAGQFEQERKEFERADALDPTTGDVAEHLDPLG